MYSKVFYIILFFCWLSPLKAQYNMSYVIDTKVPNRLNRFFIVKVKDSTALQFHLNSLPGKLIQKGFLTASIDSFRIDSTNCSVYFHLGEHFDKIRLKVENQDYYFLRKEAKLLNKVVNELEFKPREVSKLLTVITNELKNDGYPFATVTLDSIRLEAKISSFNLVVKRNRRFSITKIHVVGDSSIQAKLISNLIHIKIGDTYNQESILMISNLLKQANYIREIKKPELLFTKEGVEIYIYCKSIPVSSLNGVAGIQYNEVSKKYYLTGDINLKLLNSLKKGELFDLNWRSLQNQSQQIKLKLNYPYIANSLFGFDAGFFLVKRDSTFLNVKGNFGIQYQIKGGGFLKMNIDVEESNLLKKSLNNNYQSTKYLGYALSYSKKQLDYLPNPTKGLAYSMTTSFGTKTFRDSIKTSALAANASLLIEVYYPLFKKHVLRFSAVNYTMLSNRIFQNELYRFGGLNSLRGFNEDEIAASTFSITSIEYRFLLDQNSRLFLFFDQAVYEGKTLNYKKDHPFGFGGGISFGTSVGMFSFVYSLGSQFDNPILFRNAKIHFGYVAYF